MRKLVGISDECQNRDISMVDLVINENEEAVNECIGVVAEEINADQKALTEESKKAVKGLYIQHG